MTASDAVVLTRDGRPTHVVVPFEQWEAIVAALEDAEEARLAREAFDDVTNESLPWEMVRALADGVNRVRVWREFRGLGQEALAERAGLDLQVVRDLEARLAEEDASVRERLAQALGCGVEDLVPPRV
jgi:ribosome-binding protein aMBF1 (putative translation factor)